MLTFKFITMKRNFAFALILTAFVSLTSGCFVGYGYHHGHRHYYRGY
jgi:hypothetical protein